MIICCGEALIDMIPETLADGQEVLAPTVGGSVFNTAIALGRLGADVSFFSGVSNDLFGSQLQSSLKDSNVDISRLVLSNRPTTLAFVKLENGQAQYSFYDENTAGRMLSEADLPPSSTTKNGTYFFGGISLIAEPCASTYEALLIRECTQNVIMLDPNIRPAFITDEQKYRDKLRRMIAATDILKLSDEDLSWITGGHSAQSAAREILNQGPSVIIVTRGNKGASAHTKSGDVFIDAQAVDVIDTVGAGDTFNAGFLNQLSRNDALTKERVFQLDSTLLESALQFGVSTASIVVGRSGANSPWEHDLPK